MVDMTERLNSNILHREITKIPNDYLLIIAGMFWAAFYMSLVPEWRWVIMDLLKNGKLGHFSLFGNLLLILATLFFLLFPVLIWLLYFEVNVADDCLCVKKSRYGRFFRFPFDNLKRISFRKTTHNTISIDYGADEKKLGMYMPVAVLHHKLIPVIMLEYNDGGSIVVFTSNPEEMHQVLNQIPVLKQILTPLE